MSFSKEGLNSELEKNYSFLQSIHKQVQSEENKFEGFTFHSSQDEWNLHVSETGTAYLITGVMNASPTCILDYYENFEKFPKYGKPWTS
jgi:hypothetical protein